MAIRRKKTPEGMAESLVDAQYQLTAALANDQLNDRIRDAVHRATEAILQEDSQTVADALCALADWEIVAMTYSAKDEMDEAVARVRTDFGTEEGSPDRPRNENAQICSQAILMGMMRDEMHGGQDVGTEAVNATFALGDDVVYATLRASSTVVAHLLFFNLLTKRQMRG